MKAIASLWRPCLLILLLAGCSQQEATTPVERPVDKVFPLLDAAHSRWIYFASACRPFGMVNLSPDTEVEGAWGSGYIYDTDTIRGLSHVHGWQIAGVSVMPLVAEQYAGDGDYDSPFRHEDETVQVGYHALTLDRWGVHAEMTSTKRVGFHKYDYAAEGTAAVLFSLEGSLGPSRMIYGDLEQVDEYTVQGQTTNAPTRRRPKNFTVYFQARFDEPIQSIDKDQAGKVTVSFSEAVDALKMKVAISYTSTEHAALNLERELPHWDFERVVAESQEEWNALLSKVEVSDDDSVAVRRFYTDLWHALLGRRTISDINGAYPDNSGSTFRVGQLPLDEDGNPLFDHYNSDSFWGAQWTLTTLWGLLYPEVYEDFVRSLLVYYEDGGYVPRGPSGGNYTHVMTGASSTPFIVSAYQKGIRGFDAEKAFQGMRRNHMPGGTMCRAGYEHNSTIGGGLEFYIDQGFVPYPNPNGQRFGYHQDGPSLTMEYAYQDWTLAQMALALDKQEDYEYFIDRSQNYRNAYDAESGWMRPKDVDGNWRDPYDPYEYNAGFNESNGAQSTWFVPQDLRGLAELMGGTDIAVAKLNEQFETAAANNFTAGTSHQRGEDPNRARIPINYGNQPSIQTAFVFSHLDRPHLTQKWSTAVVEQAFSGLSPYTGYNGDEDQGLMGSLAVLMKLGLFQMTGGTEADPIYEFTTPRFRTVKLQLPNGNALTIIKEGDGHYIDTATFNETPLDEMKLPHSALMKGGQLRFLVQAEP
ncbi:MAG: GH92 family glycosyl hydrolase [Bacteroidota bacterium]